MVNLYSQVWAVHVHACVWQTNSYVSEYNWLTQTQLRMHPHQGSCLFLWVGLSLWTRTCRLIFIKFLGLSKEMLDLGVVRILVTSKITRKMIKWWKLVNTHKLCGRANRPHYGSFPSVRPSGCLSVCLHYSQTCSQFDNRKTQEDRNWFDCSSALSSWSEGQADGRTFMSSLSRHFF